MSNLSQAKDCAQTVANDWAKTYALVSIAESLEKVFGVLDDTLATMAESLKSLENRLVEAEKPHEVASADRVSVVDLNKKATKPGSTVLNSKTGEVKQELGNWGANYLKPKPAVDTGL